MNIPSTSDAGTTFGNSSTNTTHLRENCTQTDGVRQTTRGTQTLSEIINMYLDANDITVNTAEEHVNEEKNSGLETAGTGTANRITVSTSRQQGPETDALEDVYFQAFEFIVDDRPTDAFQELIDHAGIVCTNNDVIEQSSTAGVEIFESANGKGSELGDVPTKTVIEADANKQEEKICTILDCPIVEEGMQTAATMSGPCETVNLSRTVNPCENSNPDGMKNIPVSKAEEGWLFTDTTDNVLLTEKAALLELANLADFTNVVNQLASDNTSVAEIPIHNKEPCDEKVTINKEDAGVSTVCQEFTLEKNADQETGCNKKQVNDKMTFILQQKSQNQDIDLDTTATKVSSETELEESKQRPGRPKRTDTLLKAEDLPKHERPKKAELARKDAVKNNNCQTS